MTWVVAMGRRSLLSWVVWLNVLLAFMQIVVGSSVRSLALVSDGAHTLSDALAAYVAQLAESYEGKGHDAIVLPFGYLRASMVGALVNVAALEALCFSIGLTALCRLWRPEPIGNLNALAFVSVLGVCINGVSAVLTCFGHKTRDSRAGHGGFDVTSNV